MENENKPIWQAKAVYCGQETPFEHYTLTSNAITVTKGLFLKKTQNIPLHRIAAKEIDVSLLDSIFRCGKICLITRGREIPNVELHVKNPEDVLELIEKTSFQERLTFRKTMW